MVLGSCCVPNRSSDEPTKEEHFRISFWILVSLVTFLMCMVLLTYMLLCAIIVHWNGGLPLDLMEIGLWYQKK